MHLLSAISKNTKRSQSVSKSFQSIQHHSNPSQCLNHWCQRSWRWAIMWRPPIPSRPNPPKRWPFHLRGLEFKKSKSRDTWNNRQVFPWSIKWSRAKANRVLPREHTGHSKHPLPTIQEMTLYMDITDGQYQNQIDNILCSQRWRSFIQSTKTRPRADCGSDHQLLIAKFRLKLKKVGKPLGHSGINLNKIHYDYTVKVNRFKGLDLIDRVP